MSARSTLQEDLGVHTGPHAALTEGAHCEHPLKARIFFALMLRCASTAPLLTATDQAGNHRNAGTTQRLTRAMFAQVSCATADRERPHGYAQRGLLMHAGLVQVPHAAAD